MPNKRQSSINNNILQHQKSLNEDLQNIVESPLKKYKASSKSPKKIITKESIMGSNFGSQEHFLNQNVSIFTTYGDKNQKILRDSNEVSPMNQKEKDPVVRANQESPITQKEPQQEDTKQRISGQYDLNRPMNPPNLSPVRLVDLNKGKTTIDDIREISSNRSSNALSSMLGAPEKGPQHLLNMSFHDQGDTTLKLNYDTKKKTLGFPFVVLKQQPSQDTMSPQHSRPDGIYSPRQLKQFEAEDQQLFNPTMKQPEVRINSKESERGPPSRFAQMGLSQLNPTKKMQIPTLPLSKLVSQAPLFGRKELSTRFVNSSIGSKRSSNGSPQNLKPYRHDENLQSANRNLGLLKKNQLKDQKAERLLHQAAQSQRQWMYAFDKTNPMIIGSMKQEVPAALEKKLKKQKELEKQQIQQSPGIVNVDVPIKKLDNNGTVQTSNENYEHTANASPKNMNNSQFEPSFKRDIQDDHSLDMMVDPLQESQVDKNEDPNTGRSGILHEDHTTQELLPAIGEAVNEKSLTNNTAKGDTSRKKNKENSNQNCVSSHSKKRSKRVPVTSNIQGKGAKTPTASEELNKELNQINNLIAESERQGSENQNAAEGAPSGANLEKIHDKRDLINTSQHERSRKPLDEVETQMMNESMPQTDHQELISPSDQAESVQLKLVNMQEKLSSGQVNVQDKARVRSDLQVRDQMADLKTAGSRKKLDTPHTHNSTLIKEAMHNFSEKEAALEAELNRSKEFAGTTFFNSNDRSGPNRRSIVSRLSKFDPGANLESAVAGSVRMKIQGQQTSKLGKSGRDDTSSMYVTTVLSSRRPTNQKLQNRGKQSKGGQNASTSATGGGLMPIIENNRHRGKKGAELSDAEKPKPSFGGARPEINSKFSSKAMSRRAVLQKQSEMMRFMRKGGKLKTIGDFCQQQKYQDRIKDRDERLKYYLKEGHQFWQGEADDVLNPDTSMIDSEFFEVYKSAIRAPPEVHYNESNIGNYKYFGARKLPELDKITIQGDLPNPNSDALADYSICFSDGFSAMPSVSDRHQAFTPAHFKFPSTKQGQRAHTKEMRPRHLDELRQNLKTVAQPNRMSTISENHRDIHTAFLKTQFQGITPSTAKNFNQMRQRNMMNKTLVTPTNQGSFDFTASLGKVTSPPSIDYEQLGMSTSFFVGMPNDQLRYDCLNSRTRNNRNYQTQENIEPIYAQTLVSRVAQNPPIRRLEIPTAVPSMPVQAIVTQDQSKQNRAHFEVDQKQMKAIEASGTKVQSSGSIESPQIPLDKLGTQVNKQTEEITVTPTPQDHSIQNSVLDRLPTKVDGSTSPISRLTQQTLYDSVKSSLAEKERARSKRQADRVLKYAERIVRNKLLPSKSPPIIAPVVDGGENMMNKATDNLFSGISQTHNKSFLGNQAQYKKKYRQHQMDKRVKDQMVMAKTNAGSTFGITQNLIAGTDSNFGSTGEIFLVNKNHNLKSSKCDSLQNEPMEVGITDSVMAHLPSAVNIKEVVIDKSYQTPRNTNADLQFALGVEHQSSLRGHQRDDEIKSATGSIGSNNVQQNLYKKNTVPLDSTKIATPQRKLEDLQNGEQSVQTSSAMSSPRHKQTVYNLIQNKGKYVQQPQKILISNELQI